MKKNNNEISIPSYLNETYWWAYIHPRAVEIFERQWLVNLILFGNYRILSSALLEEIKVFEGSRSLQVACAYGDFSSRVLDKLGENSRLDVIDVAGIQVDNLQKKLDSRYDNVVIHQQDSNNLQFSDNSFDNVLLFFLLHEQPAEVRKKTVLEALRVCKPGGRVIYIDYHKPRTSHFLKYFMKRLLKTLEPYALDLWDETIESLHNEQGSVCLSKTTYFGEMYQKVVMQKKA